MENEITWRQVQAESGYPYPIEEHTTVTNKVRRVGRFDWQLALRAVQVNKPTHLAINCLDYLDYSNYQIKESDLLSRRAKAFVRELEQQAGSLVALLGVGPRVDDFIFQLGKERSSSEDSKSDQYAAKVAR